MPRHDDIKPGEKPTNPTPEDKKSGKSGNMNFGQFMAAMKKIKEDHERK